MLHVELYLIIVKVSPVYNVLWEIWKKKRIEMWNPRFVLRQILLTNK